jgi:hypothetical protein
VQRLRTVRLEEAALVLAAVLASIYFDRAILFTPHVYQGDTLLLEYWMRRFQDPGLFTDPLTHALLHTAYVPLGIQGIYLLASYVVDPVKFGAWGVVVVAPFSAWLVFRIIREHTAWIPAAWLGAALFLLPWSTERFSGTHARAFAQPIVLLTLHLVLRGRARWAAVVPIAGALLYPPAALLAAGVLAAAALVRHGRRPALDRPVAVAAAACGVLVIAVLLAPGLLGLPTGHLITAAAARHYPEFHSRGQMVFFRRSILDMLKGRYSGFDLRTPGAILVTAAIVMALLPPSNLRLVRREVWMTAVVSLVLFGLSYAVLFRLYLPNRYTHPLLPVCCIVIGVCFQPTWALIGRRLRPWLLPLAAVALPAAIGWLGLRVFTLGPQVPERAVGSIVRHGLAAVALSALAAAGLCVAVVARRRPAATGAALVALLSTLVSGALLVGAVAGTSGGRNYTTCTQPRLHAFLRTLPKDAIIAGDPVVLNCVPIESDRAVVISQKLYQPVDVSYLKVIRPRMFAMIKAYYGDSRRAIVRLHARYGADYFVVERPLLEATHASPAYTFMAPFERVVDNVLQHSPVRAALRLPRSCVVWHRLTLTVYDLRCVGQAAS